MMHSSKRWALLVLPVALGLLLAVAVSTVGASQAEGWSAGLTDESPASIGSESAITSVSVSETVESDARLSSTGLPDTERDADQFEPSSLSHAASGNFLGTFTNTWAYSTIGLVYDPDRNVFRYAHESQSGSSNPTIYDIDPLLHTVLLSRALSAQNTGWPWQVDNRTGAGYDFHTGTFFLPDYNGDLSYADDNIVEVDVNGNILNAWEMDDEVGSNDSSDGSEVGNIIDIAVVPGSPNRYFATASYDGGVVYEIALTRTGTWWTPNSWSTVMTYTGAISDTFTDNLGIDYDAQNEVLYHSGWHTTTILVTDLNMNPVTNMTSTFDCPGAGGYNSGVTFIEGAVPPEIWVTDFTSDQTTRCRAYGEEEPDTAWAKWVDEAAWPLGDVTKETADSVKVTDVITALDAFTLTENWNPDHLSLVDWDVSPPVGQIVTGTSSLRIVGPAGPPAVVTATKWFHVQPCNWGTTSLEEVLDVDGQPTFPVRAVEIDKDPSELRISSDYDADVGIGTVASFTLHYSNTGGYASDVKIRNEFPTSPIVHADPAPDQIWADGTRARWNVGDMATDDKGSIDVYVFIDEGVTPGSTITITDLIFDGCGVLGDETFIQLHASSEAFPLAWDKFLHTDTPDVEWQPGISVTLETEDTFLVEEFITPQDTSGFALVDEWSPAELTLQSWSIEPEVYSTSVTTADGSWHLEVPAEDAGPVTITKEFHADPCDWTETVLWERLESGSGGASDRPVVVNKEPADLWINSTYDERVYGRDETQVVLSFGNNGGFENAFSIRKRFPPEVSFLESDPPPSVGGEGDSTVVWDFGDGLTTGEEGKITVTVRIAALVPPSAVLNSLAELLNHADEVADEVVTTYRVPPPEWEKWFNGEKTSDPELTLPVFDVLTVRDVISTRSAAAIVQHWNPDRLSLIDYSREPDLGEVVSDPGFLSWEFPQGVPGTITLTKQFRIEPDQEDYPVLWEELWVEDVLWERRPVGIDKLEERLYLPLVLRE